MRDEKLLAKYFRDIHAMRRLSRDEMTAKLAVARDGTESAFSAQQDVIKGCLEVAALLAVHLASAWMSDLEAVQEANLILMKLVEDPSVQSPVAALSPVLIERYEQMEPIAYPAYRRPSWIPSVYRRTKRRIRDSRVVCGFGGHKPTIRAAEWSFSPPRITRAFLSAGAAQ